MTGRKPFTPTEEQRRLVRAMAGFGVPHDDIALVVKCSPPTLRRRFRHDLDVATIEANTRVAQTLYQQATTPGNIAATIFWLKARAGWREVQRVETTGPEGKPIATEVVYRWADSSEKPRDADAAGSNLIRGAGATAVQPGFIFPSYKKVG